jgi:hypothetical protein
MQIKTTLRLHLTPVRIAIIKNTSNNKYCWGWRKKRTLIHNWWESKLVQPLCKTIGRLLKKLNMYLPYDPAIPLQRIYLKECDWGYYKNTCTPMLTAQLFTIAKPWKQPRCPTTDEWIKTIWYSYMMEFYSVTRMNICHSQRSGWNWRTSSQTKLAGSECQKSHVLLHMWIRVWKQMQ